MARKNKVPRLKNQIKNPCSLKGKGKIKTFNSFDPLAKFDPICSLCNDNGYREHNFPLKSREAKDENPNMDKRGLDLCAHSEKNIWFVNRGCSRHMTGDKRKFFPLNKKEGNVFFGSGYAKIDGKRTVTLINGKGKAQMLCW